MLLHLLRVASLALFTCGSITAQADSIQILDFNNNQIPTGWSPWHYPQYSMFAEFANQRMQSNVGISSGIYQSFNGVGVSQLSIEYDTRISSVDTYGGGYTAALLTNNVANWSSNYIGASGGSDTTVASNQMTFHLLGAQNNVAQTYSNVVTPKVNGDYHYAITFADSKISEIVTNKASNAVISSVSKDAPGFSLASMTDIVLLVGKYISGAWMDTVKITPVSSGPTVAEAAQMSAAAYRTQGSALEKIGAYSVYPFYASSGSNSEGFSAVVYKSDAGDAVVSIRGTLPNNPKNILADLAFGDPSTGSAVNQTLPDYVLQAGIILRELSSDSNIKSITLTGHSMGGAIAEILSQSTGLKAITFDAPGIQFAYDNAKQSIPEIDTTRWATSLGTTVNYRAYGDQISLLGGNHFGAVKTFIPELANGDNGATWKQAIDSTLTADLPSVVANALFAHSIEFLSKSLATGGTPKFYDGAIGPNWTSALSVQVAKSIIVTGTCIATVGNCSALAFAVNSIDPQKTFLIDPPSAIGYKFFVDSGPLFSGLTFLSYPSGVGYQLMLWDGLNWSLAGLFHGGDLFEFGPTGVDRFLVYGYDFGLGSFATLPEGFLIGARFTDVGQVIGHIEIVPAPADIPEPSILALLSMGAVGLAFSLGRRLR